MYRVRIWLKASPPTIETNCTSASFSPSNSTFNRATTIGPTVSNRSRRIGVSFTETAFGVPMPKGKDKKFIHATLDPNHLNKDIYATIGLIGDAGLTLDALLAELGKTEKKPRDAGNPKEDAIEVMATMTKPVLLTDDQFASFKAGNLYVNVHSAAHAPGEIRAQLKP